MTHYPAEWKQTVLHNLNRIIARLDTLTGTLTPPPTVAPRGLNPHQEKLGPPHDHRTHLFLDTGGTVFLGVTQSGR